MRDCWKLTTDSAKKTRAVAACLAQSLDDGDILLLAGELGAGKSEFARGLARGLGVQGHVPSPTFTILNIYREGRLPFKHFDWYRLADGEELTAAGLDEMVGQDGVTAIEWPQRAPGYIQEPYLQVTIEQINGDQRRLTFTAYGPLRPSLADALDQLELTCR